MWNGANKGEREHMATVLVKLTDQTIRKEPFGWALFLWFEMHLYHYSFFLVNLYTSLKVYDLLFHWTYPTYSTGNAKGKGEGIFKYHKKWTTFFIE
ncbi:hypothetical protein J0K78_07565 [Halobacillus sp. GSS1]|nr:hypothetical protein [Halobacillus sp. GSS1]